MMLKFQNVDILFSLEQIARVYPSSFSKEDFDIDAAFIREAALSEDAEDRHLLWSVTPYGTQVFREWDVYLEGSSSNRRWKMNFDRPFDPVLSYALELTGIQDEKVIGTIISLDYESFVKRLTLLTCPIKWSEEFYADGSIYSGPYQTRSQRIMDMAEKHGAPVSVHEIPESTEELARILKRERFKRAFHAVADDMSEHIRSLRDEPSLASPGERNKGGMNVGFLISRVVTVYDLNQDQLDHLKESYAEQLENDDIVWGERSAPSEIPDDVISDHYDGMVFAPDDFI